MKRDPLYVPDDINNAGEGDNEEGQVDFIDNNPYIADPNFRFSAHDPLHKINWRNISRINLKSLKNPSSFDEVNQLFRQNLDDLAFADLKEEQNTVWISHEGMAAMRVMQLGMQYLMHTRSKMVDSLLSKERAVEEQA